MASASRQAATIAGCSRSSSGEEQLHREEENAAVPGISLIGDIGLGARAIGLLDESRDLEGAVAAGERLAALDIAVAGLGPARGDAEGDELAGLGSGGGARDSGLEGGCIGDRVIRWHHQHQRIGRGSGEGEGGDAAGGRGVAAERLEDDRGGRHAGEAKLLGDDEAVLVVGDDQRRRELLAVGDAQTGFLKQGALGEERQELLRILRARHRPEARARAAGEDHRMNS